MILSFKNVSKSYGTNLALNGFTAELGPGIHALLGPNGSGKTTLMNIITDNLKADGGEITFNGEDVKKMGVRFREKLGFMPQYPGMYPNFTAERFLWYMAALKGIGDGAKSRKEKKETVGNAVASVLNAVELTDVASKKIGAFSGGMKQRLALAQAMLGDPEVLILDEPTAGLDPKQRIAVRNVIAGLALNRIVIVATHIVSDVEYIAHDVILLKKGVIADCASPNDLTARIAGQVWSVPADESNVPNLQSRFRVTNLNRDEATGKVLLRVLSEEKPSPEALSVPPTLEDYYLKVFGTEDDVIKLENA